MDLMEVIDRRRAFRSLEKVEIPEDIVRDLATTARLAPSCFNNQPWRYVFVRDRDTLGKVFQSLSSGNKWATAASMVIAVCSRRDLDCVTKGREYYLFDTGMATFLLILRATELGLVAHPIAGYDEGKVKQVLGIPDDILVVTLVIVGRHSSEISPLLSDNQRCNEVRRPARLELGDFAFHDKYGRHRWLRVDV